MLIKAGSGPFAAATVPNDRTTQSEPFEHVGSGPPHRSKSHSCENPDVGKSGKIPPDGASRFPDADPMMFSRTWSAPFITGGSSGHELSSLTNGLELPSGFAAINDNPIDTRFTDSAYASCVSCDASRFRFRRLEPSFFFSAPTGLLMPAGAPADLFESNANAASPVGVAAPTYRSVRVIISSRSSFVVGIWPRGLSTPVDMAYESSSRKSHQKRRASAHKRGASKKRYAWVVGQTLVRVRAVKQVDAVRHKVAFAEPTPLQEEQQCDRCHGPRHRQSNALCTGGSSEVQSPFTDPSALYCIETGRKVGKIEFAEASIKPKARTGTGVATITLY
jgi:hypothetical protein